MAAALFQNSLLYPPKVAQVPAPDSADRKSPDHSSANAAEPKREPISSMRSLPAFSVHNSVLVNVLMVVILFAGSAFSVVITRELFPESRPKQIAITTIYPGVQPEEIEKAVTIKVEEAVRDVDGIEKLTSTVGEGISTTSIILFNSVKNIDAVLQEIKVEIDALQDLPERIESTTVRKIEPQLPVIAVAMYGSNDDAGLKKASRELRDDLLRYSEITEIAVSGTREDEISIEVLPHRLLEFDMTFGEVATAIRQTNLDVSGGQLKGDRANIAIRTLGEETRGVDLESIELRTTSDGRKILLSDVAVIRDAFVETDIESYFNGQRGVNCVVYKTGKQDAIEIAQIVKAYVAGKQNQPYDASGYVKASQEVWWWRPMAYASAWLNNTTRSASGKVDLQQVYERSRQNPFSHNYQVALHTDLSRLIEGRLDLMIRNGQSGLVLVLVSLLLFLDWRVAFWTAAGLPTAFLGSFVVMWLFGVTFNLLSLFGLIIVLGIIVDDAIIVGENIFRHIQEGMPPLQAAVVGAEEVMWPVIISVLTTVAAFLPLMFIPGQIGDFFGQLPLVVMAALSVSLLEALLILPAHLMHLKPPKRAERRLVDGVSATKPAQKGTYAKVQVAYGSFLNMALRWRYVTISLSAAVLIASLGLIAGGVVETVFIQKLDGETLICSLEMPTGTPAKSVLERLQQINAAALEQPEVQNVQTHLSLQFSVGGVGAEGVSANSHLGQVIVELQEADQRERLGQRTSGQVVSAIRQATAGLSGINALTWEILSGGPAGKDFEVQIQGPRFDDTIAVARALKAKLATYAGVVDLDDNFDAGKRELQLQLRDAARPTGITVGALGEHVRDATYGREAMRITRNREDVKVMVRYPKEVRENAFAIESMWIPTAGPPGERGWVPLKEVAELTEAQSFATIHRNRQQRAVSVMANIQEGANANDIAAAVLGSFDTELKAIYPTTEISLLGSLDDQAKSLASLKIAMPLALLMIYMMVAGLFRSYYQPLVVMLAIPFGIQGAIVGHYLTGYPMTIISAIGLVALTGIVVNDAIVLIDYVNMRVREGVDPFTANVEGSQTRLRAVFLTSETTIAGMLPLLFETSFQARFLIPMAVTICFGLLFSTLLTLLIIPSINMVFYDVLGLCGVKPLDDEVTADTTLAA